MKTLTMLLLALGVCVGCNKGTSAISGPTEAFLPAWMQEEWNVATQKLKIEYGVNTDFARPEGFKYVEEPNPWQCYSGRDGIGMCVGMFDPGNVSIHWATGWEHVLDHEFGHAILWQLGDPRWSCYEHSKPTDPNYEPACASGVR